MNGKADKGITETAARLRDEHAACRCDRGRTNASTMTKPGMKAIILENGAYAEGWLGELCDIGGAPGGADRDFDG